MADAPVFKMGACDDVTATLRFTDGSLATIAYTALGDGAYPKEMIEIFADGTVVAINNFRTLTSTAGGKSTKQNNSQDKGFSAALSPFTAAVREGGPAPVDEKEMIESSLATLAVLESLQSGNRIELPLA